MHRLAPLLVLLLAAGTAWGQQEELTPCYTCRTSECPSLDAPPCPKPRKRSSEEEKAEQEKKAREKAAREKAEQERAAREKAEQERAAREKAEQEKAAQEQAAKEQAEKDRAAQAARQERLRQEQLEQARAEQAAKEQARHAALRRGKWGALTAGLLLSGAGATLLALDNRFGRECWMPGDTSTCGETLRLHYGGAPLVAVGGVALVGAIVLFAVDARRGQPEKGARSARLTGTRGLFW